MDSHPNATQKEVISHFLPSFPHLNQTSISRIKKDKSKILATVASNPSQSFSKRKHAVKFPALEEALRIWFLQCQSRNTTVNGAILKAKAKKFADDLGIPADSQLSFSNGWLDQFRQRHMIKHYRFHGKAASVPHSDVSQAKAKVHQDISGYAPQDIYNFDEGSLNYRMPPDKGLAATAMSGIMADKQRITLGFITNADGSDIQPPLFIGHARKPRCFNGKEGKELGFQYFWNSKAWMTASIFQMYVCMQVS